MAITYYSRVINCLPKYKSRCMEVEFISREAKEDNLHQQLSLCSCCWFNQINIHTYGKNMIKLGVEKSLQGKLGDQLHKCSNTWDKCKESLLYTNFSF